MLCKDTNRSKANLDHNFRAIRSWPVPLRLSPNLQSCLPQNEFSSEFIWMRTCTLPICVGIWYLDQPSQSLQAWWSRPLLVRNASTYWEKEIYSSGYTPKAGRWNTGKLIVIKTCVTEGKPKAGEGPRCLLSASQISSFYPDVHPRPLPPEPSCSPPRGLFTHPPPRSGVTWAPGLLHFRRLLLLLLSRFSHVRLCATP